MYFDQQDSKQLMLINVHMRATKSVKTFTAATCRADSNCAYELVSGVDELENRKVLPKAAEGFHKKC
jgi:hypothetical protein